MIPSLFNLFVKNIGPQTYGINASASLGNGFFYIAAFGNGLFSKNIYMASMILLCWKWIVSFDVLILNGFFEQQCRVGRSWP